MTLTKKKLSRFLFLIFTVLLLFSFSVSSALAAEIHIYVDNKEVQCDVSPYLEKGRTYIPMRFAAEPLGAKVTWNNSTKTATFTKENTVVKVTQNSTTAYVNGEAKTLDAPATNRSGRIFVPIRFVSESLNCYCQWLNNNVYISTDGSVPVTTDGFKYLGNYFTYNSLPDLKTYQNELTDVSHFAYDLKADGSIEEKTYYQTDKFVSEGQAISESAGHNIYMLVTGFTRSDLTTVLSDSQLRAKAISEISAEIEHRGLDGVDIDFESVATNQRENYVTFIKELRQELGAEKLINISIMPRANANETWLDGYDYKGLAEYADTLSLMCYNEHYSGGDPGPVASYPWVQDVVEYTLSQGVDSKQLILSLGSYGYDWPEGGKASSVYNSTAIANAKNHNATIYRDTTSGCLYYTYTENNTQHTVWFEDATSLSQKASLATSYNLGGVGFWKLGNITDSIWAAVLEVTNHPNADAWQDKAGTTPNYPEREIS